MDQPTERPRVSKEPISLLLPVYNQASGLEAIAENWLRAFARLDRPIEFIIVDDASTDSSATVADALARLHPELKVVRHEARQGYGAALRSGLSLATHPLILLSDCQYPYPPHDIAKLLDVIDGADLVTGCRSDPVPGWLRRYDAAFGLFSRIAFGVAVEARPGWLGWSAWWRGVKLRLAFGLRLWDVMSAFKLFRRTVLDRIPIQSNGEFVHAELMAKADFLGCLMAEVPIGRLPGRFKGVPEPTVPGAEFSREARRLFRRPKFAVPALASGVASAPQGHVEGKDTGR